MFCSKCGKEISENAVVCPGCGCPTDNFQKTEDNNRSSNVTVEHIKNLGLISIFAGFIIPLAAWIVGGLGIYKSSNLPQNTTGLDEAKRLNFIGIIIGIASFVISFLVIFFCFIY